MCPEPSRSYGSVIKFYHGVHDQISIKFKLKYVSNMYQIHIKNSEILKN